MASDLLRLQLSSSYRYFPSAYERDRVCDVSRVKAPPGYINLYRALQELIKQEAAKQDYAYNHLMRLWPFTVKGTVRGLELRQLARCGPSQTKTLLLKIPNDTRYFGGDQAHNAEAVFLAAIKRLERFVSADKKLLLLKGSRGPEFRSTHILASFLRPYFSRIARTGIVFRDCLKLTSTQLAKLPPYFIVHVDEKRLKRRMAGEGERAAITRARNADLRTVLEFLKRIETQLPDQRIRFYEAKELCDTAIEFSTNWPLKESRSNGWFRARVWNEFGGGIRNGRPKLLSLHEEERRGLVLKKASKAAQTLLAAD